MEQLDIKNFKEQLFLSAEQNGVGALLTDARAEAFFVLTEHMLAVNEQFNLTAIKEPSRIILLHYIDSLLGASFFPEGARVIDVGSGAGFPAIPLAIVRPDLKITALDSTAKRVNYIADTAELLHLSNLSTLVGRAEEVARDVAYREAFDCATARAVAPLPVLCELCLPFVRVGGRMIAMKGRSGKDELDTAKNAVFLLGGKTEHFADTPISSAEGEVFAHTTVLIKKTAPCAEKYPRPFGKITKSPL